ncbi:MAG: cupin domain-containing protein [Methyloceanibacter sp.]
MRMRIAVIGIVLLAALAGAGLVVAREPNGQSGVTAEQLLAEALAGEPGKEVVAQTYTFPAGAVLPWHIHPDAHEVAYVIEGDFTFQIEGEAPRELKTGEASYLAPNVVHRGMNKSDAPVKLFVVRVKPTDKPLVTEVPAPAQ